jgi:hypothetical protein
MVGALSGATMKAPKRPRDPNMLAKLIVDLATGNAIEPVERPRSAAAELGQKGGEARAKKLSKKQRVKIAKKAAKVRWREDA